MHFFYALFSIFSWRIFMSQKKLQTMIMQNLWRRGYYGICGSRGSLNWGRETRAKTTSSQDFSLRLSPEAKGEGLGTSLGQRLPLSPQCSVGLSSHSLFLSPRLIHCFSLDLVLHDSFTRRTYVHDDASLPIPPCPSLILNPTTRVFRVKRKKARSRISTSTPA